jgi:putative ABC transport system substrate-binding protein
VRRREFITLLGGATAWPLVAHAQEDRTYRVGVLNVNARRSPVIMALLDELRRHGFVEGRNLVVESSGIGQPYARFPDLAREMLKTKVEVLLVGGGGPPVRSVQAVAPDMPIISVVDDMVAEGVVQSLARPGGNVTGVSILAPELDSKRQQLLMELLPNVRRMAALADPRVQTPAQLQVLQEAARSREVELSIYPINSVDDIIPAIEAAKAGGAGGLNLLGASLIAFQRQSIIARTAALHLPAIYQWPDFIEEGALIGYGPVQAQVYRQVARMLVKLLRGAKPADVPVEQPAIFELAINLETANAIGLTVPMALLSRADKVI